MRSLALLMVAFITLPAPAWASVSVEKEVSRIDTLIAAIKGGRLTVEAKGAVKGGGWKHAALKPVKSAAPADAHVLVLDFVAVPPDPNEAVIPGLLPVGATITLKPRKGIVSVRAVSSSNEITTQILR